MYVELSLLFLILIIVGTFLTLLLFKFDLKELKDSGLDKKILMWVPFAILFLLVLYLGPVARFILFFIIITASIFEFSKITILTKKAKGFLYAYFFLYVISFVHLGLIRFVFLNTSDLLLYLIVGTVVSDVCGFFFGKFFGGHKLPEIFNKKKSWEGVLGQIVGALIGVLLIKYFILHHGSILIFIPIGIGSTLGDLANSGAKKLANVKNWSNSIPGHGGFVDRFCSLAGSSLITFYYILLFLH
jgi:phosphatidate cytidylyltransferase